MEKSQFKVIIVGGSIAGLTLAHCLRQANISHIVIEKRGNISPQEGASVGLWPNGLQILQQLGLYEDLERLTEPLQTLHVSYPDGFSFTSPFPRSIHERFGYPIVFLDRQKILQVLHERYPDKSNIHVNTKATEIRPSDNGISVVTDDGTVYHGDLVVGADGVHSKVRSEMWRLSDESSPGSISQDEKKNMTVVFACVFGISSQIDGLVSGEHTVNNLDGLTILTFHGKSGRVFWFVIKKLDQTYTYPNAPRFSTDDAALLCGQLGNVRVWKDVCIKDIWKNREVVSMTALEEGFFQTWHCDRIVLMGDSVHKMTVNIGQGANTAIEDAAVLSSLINRLINSHSVKKPSNEQITRLLREYQTARYTRVKQIYDRSRLAVRFQARDGFLKAAFGRYIVPYIGNLADRPSQLVADGEVIDFLPRPERSGPGWVDFSSRGRSGLRIMVYSVVVLLLYVVFWMDLPSYMHNV
ncbi:hypothetical protein AWENTII_000062 [Aspergillus wentii]